MCIRDRWYIKYVTYKKGVDQVTGLGIGKRQLAFQQETVTEQIAPTIQPRPRTAPMFNWWITPPISGTSFRSVMIATVSRVQSSTSEVRWSAQQIPKIFFGNP